jgi:hypothetical protein
MPRFSLINGELVQYTSAEESAADAKAEASAIHQTARDTKDAEREAYIAKIDDESITFAEFIKLEKLRLNL